MPPIRSHATHLAVTVAAASLLGCGALAIAMAPAKTQRPSSSPAAAAAKASFWEALHGQRFASLPDVSEHLTRAYLESPRDGELTLLLAHAHFWAVAERERSTAQRAGITDHFVLARFYFQQAAQLRPDDARIPGWLGGIEAALGRLNDDERLGRRGYYTLREGAARFPEFNHFSLGYALSNLPRDHERFPEAVEAMWASVDVCAGERVDRDRADYSAYTLPWPDPPPAGPKRVCWNSEIAPHNFEGFFLHNGDLLVKAGRPETARRMYANARLAPSYPQWPYRDLLEASIASAEERAHAFATLPPDLRPPVMVQTAHSCTGCHASH